MLFSLAVDDAIGVVLAVMAPGRSEWEPVTEEPWLPSQRMWPVGRHFRSYPLFGKNRLSPTTLGGEGLFPTSW